MYAQPSIFAQGTGEHAYVEFDLLPGADPLDLVTGLATVHGPEAAVSGVSAVIAFRPELWAALRPAAAPAGVSSFTEIVGPEITFPASQHDAWLWVAGSSRGAVFDATRTAIDAVAGCARPVSEVTGWHYQRDRDLTGFIDGTENPAGVRAVDVVTHADEPGRGSSIALVQQWAHTPAWVDVPVADQERVIGRSKPDSVELDEAVMPADSHVSRTVVEEEGAELKIYRRNTAYGAVTEHGTMFVGFCATQHPLQIMLERMAGVGDGVRDALTRYTTPLTGAYYVAPSIPALAEFVPVDED
ncbi:Dyp-type peroxidase [Jatrophihabitans sp.]|uniref:Dyp-type peroxidase n=1 Tax=Jatrophihabitans sp. TaxID=1932789 RepID=UPI0030C6EB4F|nr:Dyp-type peroxidase family [Jatrophihabitans sp.]